MPIASLLMLNKIQLIAGKIVALRNKFGGHAVVKK
jgi:hypothetical protein